MSKIKDLNTFRHGNNGSNGDFVILETPTPSSSSNILFTTNISQSNQWEERNKKHLFGQFQEAGDDEEEDGNAYDDFKVNNNGVCWSFNVDHRPSTPLRTRAILAAQRANNANYYNWRQMPGIIRIIMIYNRLMLLEIEMIEMIEMTEMIAMIPSKIWMI